MHDQLHTPIMKALIVNQCYDIIFLWLFSPALFTDVPAIPTPTSVDMYRDPSKCNRNHRLIPLSHEHNKSRNTVLKKPFLPGLVCLTCKKCVAVYQPENIDNCRSSNQDNHYRNIEKILRSTNEKKVICLRH